jgi:hypothetical protein
MLIKIHHANGEPRSPKWPDDYLYAATIEAPSVHSAYELTQNVQLDKPWCQEQYVKDRFGDSLRSSVPDDVFEDECGNLWLVSLIGVELDPICYTSDVP